MKESKKVSIISIILLSILMTALLTFALMIYASPKINVSRNYNLVGYFSPEKKGEIHQIVNDAKEEYFFGVNKINFVSDSNLFKNYCNVGNNTLGCNKFSEYSDGSTYDEVDIFAPNKSPFIKTIFCHELLHNKFPRGEEYHQIVYSLSRKGVCYE